MIIDSSGNVGIGTTDPDASLHIFGDGTNSVIFLGEDGAVDKTSIFKYSQGSGAGTGNLNFFHWGDADGVGLNINKGGNVGINEDNPQAYLHINRSKLSANIELVDGIILGWDDANTQDTQAGDGMKISFHTSSVNNSIGTTEGAYIGAVRASGAEASLDTDLVFATRENASFDVTERMRIKNDGLVGIGTNNPSVSLDVSGEIKTELCSTIGTLGFILLDRQNVSVPGSFGTCIFDLDNQSTDAFAMYKFIFRGQFDGNGTGTGAIDLQFRDIDGAMATGGGHIKYLRRGNNTIQYNATEGTNITISYIDDPSNSPASRYFGELIISTGSNIVDCNLIGHSMYRAGGGLVSNPEIQRSDFNGAIWDTESVNTRITGFSLRRSGDSSGGSVVGSVFRML
jgi:hypothetical protein